MKKKVVAGLLAAVLAISALSGCGSFSLPRTDPGTNVETIQEADGGIDYAKADNWAYYGIGEDRDADLFLVCPTVDMKDEFNMSLDDEDTKASFIGALNMERGIYEDSTRMYAPFYRQAAMKIFSLDREDWEPYLEFAYRDVSSAFAYYLEHENKGRPIILAGFSQGANMCYRLLEEYFGDEELYSQLVAVYAIGWPCTEELTENYPQIKPAASADDIGAVISFDCEAPEITETVINPAGQKAYAINPLNWRTDETYADKSENLGACFTKSSGEIRSEQEAFCGGFLDTGRGVLKISDISASDYAPGIPVLPEGAYHLYDYQFFFRNLQQNVPVRLTSYFRSLRDEIIEYWNPQSPAMQSIVSFVTESTDEESDGFIPEADRIVVFDMDGTLYGERFPTYFNDWLFIQRALYDESFEAPAYLKAFARSWEDKVLKGIPIDDFDALERELGPKLYEGLTPEAYAEVVRSFKELPVRGFTGMTYGEAYFQPMVSLVKYLYENDYTIYIVSATYRDAVRVMTEGVLEGYIPSDHVIGTDLLSTASKDAAGNSMFYEYTPEDELVISGELFLKNQKTNKVTSIQREIGKVPVLAFGNSTGDFSMATYTLGNEKYDTRAYMLLCDDIERDYGDPEAAAAFQEKCDANGFYTICMRDEFELLYPEGVSMEAPDSEEADLFESEELDEAA